MTALSTNTPEFVFTGRVTTTDVRTFDVTGGDVSYKTLGVLSDAPIPQFSDRADLVDLKQNDFKNPVRKSDIAQEAKRGAKAVQSVLKGSVQGISSEFLHCQINSENGRFDVDVPLQICPDDVQYEGVAIEIDVGSEEGYRSLRIRRVEGIPLTPDLKKVVDDVLDWVNSL